MTAEQQAPQINIVVPLYNEEATFPELVKRLTALMESEPMRITAILVDDGSRDATPLLMRKLAMSDERFQAIFLSRNFGHQLALTAGLTHIDATEAVLIIDGDLQDPPELLGRFYAELKNGYEVVYAVREKRKENFVKRTAYNAFYKLLKRISYIDIPLDSGDFSLISRQVADELNQMPEASRFIRGMRSWVGFNQIGIPYERTGRTAGESKYTLRKLIGLALNGIFNFSEYPIKFITTLGILTISSSIIYFLVTLIKKLVYDTVPEGFSALLFVIILFGGVQLIAIGIIGEYILRIFFQVKNRPLFIVRNVIKNRTQQNG